MRAPRGPTRRNALDKLATLSAHTASTSNQADDLDTLYDLGRPNGAQAPNGDINGARPASDVPMGIRELEVLLALCKAAPLIQAHNDASKLLNQLSPYLPEAHRQVVAPTSLLQHLPPWGTLSYELTSAVLAIGLEHPSLRQLALSRVDETIDSIARSASYNISATAEVDVGRVAEHSLASIQLSVSLLGCLNAATKYARVWTSEQRLRTIQKLRSVLSEDFMVSLEGALSAVRNSRGHGKPVRDWKRWVRQYAIDGNPLGAMLLQKGFMNFVEASAVLLVTPPDQIQPPELLPTLLSRTPLIDCGVIRVSNEVIESLTGIIADEIALLDADADYLRLSSAWQQRLALTVKASSLRSFLCLTILNEDIADDEVFMAWLDLVASDPVQMADEALAQTTLMSMAVLSRTSQTTALNLSRSLPRMIVQGKMTPQTATVAGESLATVLKLLSQDVIISTLYSLGNVLSASAGTEQISKKPFLDPNGSTHRNTGPYEAPQRGGSSISLVVSDEEETAAVYGTVVHAIVAVAVACNKPEITALVLSMLIQKIGRINAAIDARIVSETALLGTHAGPGEFRALLKLYSKVSIDSIAQNNTVMQRAVTDARIQLATSLPKSHPMYPIYLVQLLGLIVSSGDTAGDTRKVDIALATQTIASLLRPLAVLASIDPSPLPDFEDPDLVGELGRDAWFNLVVHGFTLTSQPTREHMEELRLLAQHSLPLVDEGRVDLPESGIDLDTVLWRGNTASRMAEQKSSLVAAMPTSEAEIKALNYNEAVFLNAALLVSTLRARSGDCTAILPYFTEGKVKGTAMGNVMMTMATNGVDAYLQKATTGKEQAFAAPQLGKQLATFFENCCHRISKVQIAAVTCADRIMNNVPSALCQKPALFALLELLTLMWRSCLDAETDEYEWKSSYRSERGNVNLQLSDDISFRQATLSNLQKRSRRWVSQAIEVAPLDVKGLLQAYLEEYEDDGAYGHVALGRSFAVEMGSMIPASDQRLTALDSQREVGINTASDFMAQYTTRQEYRHLGNVAAQESIEDDWALVNHNGEARTTSLQTENPVKDSTGVRLTQLAKQLRAGENVPFERMRDVLRDAAGVLSRGEASQCGLIHELVSIPFLAFDKQTVKLGISLWMGVIKENPSLETRVLVEIAAGWESSVRLGKGFFNSNLQHPDPFYVKEEFAPMNREPIVKRQQAIHNLIAPHYRLATLLSSHFSASRLTAPAVERVYARLMRITMLAMRKTVSHPLAREVHFHMVLLALKALRLGTQHDSAAEWRLKDAILSAGLAWFANPPRWSFGGNRLQVKAEIKILGDVTNLLQTLGAIGSKATRSLASLQPKQELLQQLISHEVGRLTVWITPLQQDQRTIGFGGNQAATKEASITALLTTAWIENPKIAVQIATRFHSDKMAREVRTLLMKQPEKAVGEPDALHILIGASLPSDLKSQLKYLLYWAPINPMAAVVHFLPAYGNHPFILQYAMRALESHSVDVTFFYVPQIVQSLRYDAMGYVERYIIETAKFSQLFAHQIIWNMKANAYKDEDSEEPDPMKPTLDRVMDALIASFSKEDKEFYEREFDFFGKVTGISGKLKPFIKRPKPEKKQKIEEELRQIQVDVGVYLPSNPDGVVIGIDRKSGKPLQSHAKAPYMATFRIRKEEEDLENAEQALAQGREIKRRSYEVWQSAIFKVGDDCRQDVLALQLIAAFRGIFNTVGLDVYVFPYRVTATAPGCGVIDVLPQSISRDMLGREAVNGLYEYFVSKYGNEDSPRFQSARSNFVKSMAAYSIISYLLQFKDRHNGNIMVDEAGHILHIDFGFCFDIAPGGVKFERAPFKLSPEMVAVMGRSTSAPAFKAFEELCVKAFLAARQYVEQLSHIVMTMLDSGLPCFKPQTIQHFRERFVLDKSEREAAEFVRKLVHWSERSYSTGVYDYFQLLTNGIPY